MLKNRFLLFRHHSGCLATEMRSLQALRILSFTCTVGRHSPKQAQPSEILIFRLPNIRSSGIDANIWEHWPLLCGSSYPDAAARNRGTLGQELLELTLPRKRWRQSSSSAPKGGSPRRLRQKGELAPLSQSLEEATVGRSRTGSVWPPGTLAWPQSLRIWSLIRC